jgi:hypothetical protein
VMAIRLIFFARAFSIISGGIISTAAHGERTV